MYLACVGIAGDDIGKVQRTGTQHLGVGASQAVLQGPADRRAQLQRADPADRLGEFLDQEVRQPLLQAKPRLEVARHDNDLRMMVAWRQDGQRQVETDHIATDIRGVELRVAAGLDEFLDPLHRIFRGKDRTGPRQLEIDDQLVAVGRREELPVDLAKSHISKRNQRGCDCESDKTEADGKAQQCLIGAQAPARRRFSRARRRWLEQHRTKDRREQHRHEPRGDQRDGHHLEQGNGVLAPLTFRKADRHKARNGDQRADQHRRGQGPVGKAGCLFNGVSRPKPPEHRIHRRHRVIHEQGQRDDERAKRHPLQVDLHDLHDHEHDGERDGNRDGHHCAGPHPEHQKADGQNDANCLPERGSEVADGQIDHRGLIGNQDRFDPDGQIGCRLRHHPGHIHAQFQDIAALGHGNRQRDGALPVHPQQRLRRVDERPSHSGDVAKADRAATRDQRYLQHVGFRGEGPRHAQRQVLGAGIDHA